jgi:hypothetical protein
MGIKKRAAPIAVLKQNSLRYRRNDIALSTERSSVDSTTGLYHLHSLSVYLSAILCTNSMKTDEDLQSENYTATPQDSLPYRRP